MDYRNRNYYLVTIDPNAYDMRMRYFYNAAPSLKMYGPYNHFKYGKRYDGESTKGITQNTYWQLMMSCKKEDSEALEYELRKAKRMDKPENSWSLGSYFLRLDKALCGQ